MASVDQVDASAALITAQVWAPWICARGLPNLFDEIEDHTEQLPSKDSTTVLYCRSGGMSTTAAQDLVSLGYTNVIEVDGGFNAWEAAGFELLHNR